MNKKLLIALSLLAVYLSKSLATEYGAIQGAMNFVNGDKVNSTHGGFAISDSTEGGTGIQVVDNGKVIINALFAGSASSGINLSNGSSNHLGTGSIISVDSSSTATGLHITDSSSSASQLTADSLTVQVKANGIARGVNVYSSNTSSHLPSRVNLSGKNVINIATTNANTASFSYGIFIGGNATNQASFYAEQLNLKVTGSGETVHGVNVQPNAMVSIGSNKSTRSYIEVDSKQSLAIMSFGDAFIGNNLYIVAKGETAKDATAVTIQHGTFELNNSVIDSQGVGVAMYDQATSGKLTNVTINAGSSYALSAQSTSVKIALDNSQLTYKANNGASSGSAVWAVLGGRVNVNNSKISSDRVGILASRAGNVELSGNTVVNAGTGLAMNATDANSSITTASAGSKMYVLGNMTSEANGKINLTMNPHSYFKGAAQTTGATLNLAMTDSLWDMTASSTVNELTLHNTQVNYVKDTSSILQVDQLSGVGQFGMDVDMAAQQGQLLKINKTTTGQFKLAIANKGNAKTTGQEQLLVVETADGGGDFSLAHAVEAGGYQYGLRRDAVNTHNWQLYATGKLTSTAQAAAGDFLNAAYLLNYIDTQTLLQRMGELRASSVVNDGFWLRGFAGKLNSFSSNKLSGYGMDYNGYQLGIDKLISLARGNLYLGIMAGYTHANPDYSQGTGTVKDYSAGFYATYLDQSGIYVDTVAKYLYIKNDFNVRDSAAVSVSGTGRQKGYSLSLELGKRWPIAQTHFYLEPQTQFTYSQMSGASSSASNGLKVRLQGYESLLGRASLVVGYQLTHSTNPIDLYVKSGYVREFSGNTAYQLNGHKEKHDFAGGWVDSALGVTAQFNKNHQFYGEVGYANGNRFDKQQVNLGYRYQF